MIQDIAPHRLNNAFDRQPARPDSVFFAFQNGKILLAGDSGEGKVRLPVFRDLAEDTQELREKAVYAFSVDEKPMFLIQQQDMVDVTDENMQYGDLHRLYHAEEKWEALAGVTAGHLNRWYREHTYCGCCGRLMDFSDRERAMICPDCGNTQYPRISPVIMAAVTDGERLLVTRYAGRPYKGLALIAGFVEIGESLEQALKREVMEEVGLEVKELRYFGSQPWGFSDSVISGFFTKLSGSDRVRLDRDELSEAVWLSREEIPPQNTGVSITAEMIEAFRMGNL